MQKGDSCLNRHYEIDIGSSRLDWAFTSIFVSSEKSLLIPLAVVLPDALSLCVDGISIILMKIQEIHVYRSCTSFVGPRESGGIRGSGENTSLLECWHPSNP
jgi:hypothetical protein